MFSNITGLRESGAGLETLDPAQEFFLFGPDDKDRNKPTRDAAKTKLYGVEQIQLTPPSAMPSILLDAEKKTVNVHYFGYDAISILESAMRMNHHVVQILDYASDDMVVCFCFDSPGGSVTAAANVISAMRRTRAHVKTVAMGDCMSAAAFMWSAGKERISLPSSLFMYHYSSHGTWGNTRQIASAAQALETDVTRTYFDKILEDGLLTRDEYDMALAGENVYIDGFTMMDRLATLTEGARA